MDNNNDIDDDPVVKEMPVYFNTTEDNSKSLYVLQYPLRPSYRPLERPSKALWKPRNEMLHLEVPIERVPEHFDSEAESYLQQKHQVLSSSVVPPTTNYMMGVVDCGALHLTPLSAVLQMRPDFAHIDKAVEEEEAGELLDDFIVKDGEEEEEEEKVEETKAISVTIQKQESERALSIRQNSYEYKRMTQQSEKWLPLSINEEDDAEALLGEITQDSTLTMSQKEFCSSIKTQERQVASASDDTKMDVEEEDEGESDEELATALKAIRTYKLLPFKELKSHFSAKSDDEILEVLKECTILVNGCFALACTQSTDSKKADIRDSVLYVLSEHPKGIARAEIEKMLSLDYDDVKAVLNDYARLERSTRMWFLKEQDALFEARNPLVANYFKERWESRVSDLAPTFPILLTLS